VSARADSVAVRLAAFFSLAAFASLEYMTLVLHPPGLRVLGAAAIATAGGAALAAAGWLVGARAAVRWGALVLGLVTAVAGVLVIGVPARLLVPAHWHTLGREVGHGLDGLAGWRWPYRDGATWSRIAVLAVVPIATTLAAAVCFWPTAKGQRVRRLTAFAVLLALFLTGAVNQIEPAWRVQGAALLVLIAAWFALPAVRGQSLGRAARWLLACLVGALLIAPVVNSGRPWIDYANWDPIVPKVSFQWDQLYGPNPWPHSTATMFQVQLARPSLLRVTSLDRFDGLRFLRSDAPPGSRSLDLPATAGFRPRSASWATIIVGDLRSTQLVGGEGTPLAVSWLGSSPASTVGEADGTLQASSPPNVGTRYVVASYDPRPTLAALRSAPRAFPRAYLPYAQFELPAATASALVAPNLAHEAAGAPDPARLVGPAAPGQTPASLPAVASSIEDSPYAPMFALARRLAAGAPTTYDVVERVLGYFVGRYRYDERAPRARYPLEAFLFATRRGYCQQFSGAMTLLLRMDGIPARVGVGFRPGLYDPTTGTWRVRARDAHAWVEAYFTGIGWVSFDPTPPAPAAASGETQRLSKAAQVDRSAAGGSAATPRRHRSIAASAHARHASAAWPLALAVLALAALLALAGWWAAGAWRLRRALAGDASGAVAELDWALQRIGRELPAGMTLARLHAYLEERGADRAGGYVRALTDLRFAGAGPRPTRGGRAALRRALGRGVAGHLRALRAIPPGALRRGAGHSAAS
jgi:transglutaminase-like putative cysteine protease